MKFRVFITGSGISSKAISVLEGYGCTYLNGYFSDSLDEMKKDVAAFDPHALIVRQGNISGEVISSAPNLKVISKHGVGVDNIDVKSASEHRIPVFITANANYNSVAEHTLALTFAMCRYLSRHDHNIRNGIFDKSCYLGMELRGKCLGLIGFGRVGRRISEMVGPLGMNVLVYHPSLIEEILPAHITKAAFVDEVFSQADILSLNCPLVPETHHLVNEKTLRLMMNTAYLINTARGGVINEQDLYQALLSGQIAGAALDVFEQEPLSPDNPLLRLKNVLFTPHVAGLSDKSTDNMGVDAVNHVMSVLLNRDIDKSSCINRSTLIPVV